MIPMKPRCFLFDVYQTLLRLEPPDAPEAAWESLWATVSGARPVGLGEAKGAIRAAVRREQERARMAGITWPEVYWPNVLREALPELGALGPEAFAAFLREQVRVWHRSSLMPGAAELLSELIGRGVPLGIASNAQPYTPGDLARHLEAAGLPGDPFAPDLVFWSFAHGFAKPDPAVFRLLAARLRIRGIAPEEALMVGDNPVNDMAPARANGFATWHLIGPDMGATPDGPGGGMRHLLASLSETGEAGSGQNA